MNALVLEGVNFEFNSAQLTTQAKGILDRVVRVSEKGLMAQAEVAGTNYWKADKLNRAA